jgi:hypothetical protein
VVVFTVIFANTALMASLNMRNLEEHTPRGFAEVELASTLLYGRGLHSFTSQLNLSAFCGTGGTFRGCPGGV